MTDVIHVHPDHLGGPPNRYRERTPRTPWNPTRPDADVTPARAGTRHAIRQADRDATRVLAELGLHPRPGDTDLEQLHRWRASYTANAYRLARRAVR